MTDETADDWTGDTDERADNGAGDTGSEASSDTDRKGDSGTGRQGVDEAVESYPALGSNEAENPFDELGPSSGDTADIDELGDANDLDDAFEPMDVGTLDDEEVWEVLDEDISDPGRSDPSFGSSAIADTSNKGGMSNAMAEAGDDDHKHADRDVDKRAYCQQCPHFSAPPEAACTHEGTTIVEVVDVDEFRVRNCPLVSKADRAAESARDI